MFRKLASIPKDMEDLGGGFYRKAHEVWRLEASDDEKRPFKLIRVKSEKKFEPEAGLNKQAGMKRTASLQRRGRVFRAGNLVEVTVRTDDGDKAEVEHDDGVIEILPSTMVHDALPAPAPDISTMQMIPEGDDMSTLHEEEKQGNMPQQAPQQPKVASKGDTGKKFKPTQSMANNAKRGMEYRKKNGGKGGTSVGMGMARKLMNGTELTQAEVNKMHSFFSRHDGNQKVKEGKKPHEDNGHIAWLLWGGDSGKNWAASKASSNKEAQQDEEFERPLEDVLEEVEYLLATRAKGNKDLLEIRNALKKKINSFYSFDDEYSKDAREINPGLGRVNFTTN